MSIISDAIQAQCLAREMTHRAVSREYALDRDMTPEQLYAVISEEIDDIYANG